MMSAIIDIVGNNTPSGFTTWRTLAAGVVPLAAEEWSGSKMVVSRRERCVIAMPIEAKASDVRIQARNMCSGTFLSAKKPIWN